MTLGCQAPELLAAQFFDAKDAWRERPFWADGGTTPSRSLYAPSAHYLSAQPDWVERIRVDELPWRGLGAWLDARLQPSPGPVEHQPLYVVALAYDAGRNLEPWPSLAVRDTSLPDIIVARYPAYLWAEYPGAPWLCMGIPAARERLLRLSQRELVSRPKPSSLQLSSNVTQASYQKGLAGVLEGIRAGALYQANISRRLSAACPSHHAPYLYQQMRRLNPAAFGSLWAIDRDQWLASSSPECLLSFDASMRSAHSFPIKGTRARGEDRRTDMRLAEALQADPKERAEHVMIVDLVRNDLGRVACLGGVSVPALFSLLKLPTVQHLVSDVKAELRPEVTLGQTIQAVFPGGSITGAPKVASIAKIEATERVRRGLYTGSLGLVVGGEATFNILIRSAVFTDEQVFYQTGGGIVADSDPELEWAETEAKAAAFVNAVS